MAKGLSVHVGVNQPDPSFQMGTLKGCVKDAKAMQDLAIAHGFESLGLFVDQKAKFAKVKQAILSAAQGLHDGDIFLFTFSGHGSTQTLEPGVNVPDEPDHQDETILLFDCILIDNYVRRVLWSKFDEGVRILGVADCCHAGTALFAIVPNDAIAAGGISSSGLGAEVVMAGVATADVSSVLDPNKSGMDADEDWMEASVTRPRFREFTEDDRKRIIERSQNLNDVISEELSSEGKEPKATILTLAACKDNEKALDGDDHGVFTKAMLEVLAGANPPKNYEELMSHIIVNLSAKGILQHPMRCPRKNPDLKFLAEKPFSIETP